LACSQIQPLVALHISIDELKSEAYNLSVKLAGVNKLLELQVVREREEICSLAELVYAANVIFDPDTPSVRMLQLLGYEGHDNSIIRFIMRQTRDLIFDEVEEEPVEEEPVKEEPTFNKEEKEILEEVAKDKPKPFLADEVFREGGNYLSFGK